MSQGFPLGPPDEPYACTCLVEECDYFHLSNGQEEGQQIMVMHVLVKHPELYYTTTGKDPEESKRQYKIHLDYYRKVL